MPERSKGGDLRSPGASLAGSNPAPSIHVMKNERAIFVHDVATICFLAPYSALCVAEVFFGWSVYPLFLTHALMFHMIYDASWIYLQPAILPAMHEFIIFHHLVAISLLCRPLTHPEDSGLTSLSGLIEIDTSMVLLKRLFRNDKNISYFFDLMYRITNVMLRVYFETMMIFFVWGYYRHHDILTRLHILGGQVFITVFSYGICALTFSRSNPALKD